MTATESHRLAKTGIPNRQKTGPEPAVSCKNGYFRPAAPPPCSTDSGFFTDDEILSTLHGKAVAGRPLQFFGNPAPYTFADPGRVTIQAHSGGQQKWVEERLPYTPGTSTAAGC